MIRGKYFGMTFLLLVLVSIPRLSLAIYQWIDEKGVSHISDSPRPSQERKTDEGISSLDEVFATKSSPSGRRNSKSTVSSSASQAAPGHLTQRVELNNRALRKVFEYGDPDKKLILRLLREHDFQSLEKLYQDMLQQYKREIQYEAVLLQAFNLHGFALPLRTADLDLWVEQTGSATAYAIRGIWKAGIGYQVRGGRTIDETPSKKFEEMERLHKEAADDLIKAVRKNAELIPAYTSLVNIAKASNLGFTPKQVIQKAEEIDDRIYVARYLYMVSLLPQWGGSFTEMEQFARHAAEYIDLNPRLWSFQGEVDAEQAMIHYRAGKYHEAIDSMTKALKFGDRLSWLERRALCYEKLGLKDEALRDYEKIRSYEPKYQPPRKTDDVSSKPTSTEALASMKFVSVKGGCFQMGNLTGGPSTDNPLHTVCVSDFSIGQYPVTYDQWVAVMGKAPLISKCNTCPVLMVSWNDTQEFIWALNNLTGKKYRLPTEAEWEYAARSGGKNEQWAGTNQESELGDYVWYRVNADGKAHPVGQKKPNGLGIYDMGGNVLEWVADWYDMGYYRSSPRNDPPGPPSGSQRVQRGGCWMYPQGVIRSSTRFSETPNTQSTNQGFRLAAPAQ